MEVQEAFSAEYYPTIWHVLLLYEDFMAKWWDFANNPKIMTLWLAIGAGIESLKKYYKQIIQQCTLCLCVGLFIIRFEPGLNFI